MRSESKAGLALSYNGHCDEGVTGWFIVYELALTDDMVVSAAIDFFQMGIDCSFGSLRYRSKIRTHANPIIFG